jgi:acetyltransferase-like isoleucine patch superfamily enzyme
MENRAWQRRWMRFWMRRSGTTWAGRWATRLAAIWAHPHKARDYLARMSKRGYISPKTVLYHGAFWYGDNVFIDDRVVLFQRPQGGAIRFGDRVCIYRDTILETGYGGGLSIDTDASVHPRCQLNAYVADIRIGRGVMLAPNCALYPYDHGIAPDRPINEQKLVSKGPIIIGDDAWLGVGVIVLGGVTIGPGAVIGAGALVTEDVPAGGIAVGNPARTVRMRKDLAPLDVSRKGTDAT